MKVKLCCIFNYAPLYRESIYKKIDDEFDTQFYFDDIDSDIAKLNYSIFKKTPQRLTMTTRFGLSWRKGIQFLPFSNYDTFLVIGDYNLSFIPFLIICRILGKPVIAWGHGRKSWGGKTAFFSKLQMRLFTYYLTYGEGGKKRLIELGVPENKIQVIYNSLNDGVNAEERKICKSDVVTNHFNNNYPTLLFVGRLTKVKKLNWLIDAIKDHNRKGIYYNLLIIGDGSEYESLRKLAEESGLSPRIWFYGECYDNSVLNQLIYNVDLCVSPGNVGLTALHSMMYGTPVLSNNDFETQMPEFETIIEGKTGSLFKKDDFEDFCDKIEKWITADINRDEVRMHCYEMINDKWNSNNQINIIKKVIQE